MTKIIGISIIAALALIALACGAGAERNDVNRLQGIVASDALADRDAEIAALRETLYERNAEAAKLRSENLEIAPLREMLAETESDKTDAQMALDIALGKLEKSEALVDEYISKWGALSEFLDVDDEDDFSGYIIWCVRRAARDDAAEKPFLYEQTCKEANRLLPILADLIRKPPSR